MVKISPFLAFKGMKLRKWELIRGFVSMLDFSGSNNVYHSGPLVYNCGEPAEKRTFPFTLNIQRISCKHSFMYVGTLGRRSFWSFFMNVCMRVERCVCNNSDQFFSKIVVLQTYFSFAQEFYYELSLLKRGEKKERRAGGRARRARRARTNCCTQVQSLLATTLLAPPSCFQSCASYTE